MPDASMQPDAFVPPGDGSAPAPDARVSGTRAYLDRCVSDADCASGQCTADRGSTSFCTRSCTTDLECAHEHTCQGSLCVPDDTGHPCSVGAPESCAAGLCLGSAAGGQCTRFCESAAECPAGYACTRAGGSARPICVDVERPCAAAADCGTNLCISTIGCTAACTTAADCPRRLPGLPPYDCRIDLGSPTPICMPPSDIIGSDPAGAACRYDTGGLQNFCRSTACDTSAPLGPMCTQACTAQGGCGPGLACFPLEEDGSVTFVCERAGTLDLTEPCTRGRDCRSGLCWDPGYCTRLCADGFCPTGTSCATPLPGVSLCLRP